MISVKLFSGGYIVKEYSAKLRVDVNVRANGILEIEDAIAVDDGDKRINHVMWRGTFLIEEK